ncbi:MAG: hypothetical protein IPN74_20235 [Haliscomenobacter sp.]|nr:hypothetical protein [Haliscomenobacter sp.]
MQELSNEILTWLASSRDPKTGLELLRISGHPGYKKLLPFRYAPALPIPRREELRKALQEVLQANGGEYQQPARPTPDPETAVLRDLRARRDRLVFLRNGHEGELAKMEGGVLHPGMSDRKYRANQAIKQLSEQIAQLDKQIQEEGKKSISRKPPPIEPPIATPATARRAMPAHVEPAGTGEEPAGVRALREKAKGLHKKQAYYHALMSEASRELDTPERQAKLLEFAQKIMDEIQPAMDQVYEEIGHWKETGQAPPEGDAQDGVRQQKRLLSIRSSISRYRKMIRETENPDRQAMLSAKIEDLELELKK